jgi:hypothetical protein
MAIDPPEPPPLPSGEGNRPFLARVVEHPVAQWWSFETWTKAADLGLKLLGVVAAVAALNLFTVGPRLALEAHCRRVVDRERVAELYFQRYLTPPPTIVRQSIDAAETRAAAAQGLAPRLRCVRSIAPETILKQRNTVLQLTAVSRVRSRRGRERNVVTKAVVKSLSISTTANLSGNGQRSGLGPSKAKIVLGAAPGGAQSTRLPTPAGVLTVDKNTILDREQLALILKALREATSVRALVTITNRGKGSASNVEIESPLTFSPSTRSVSNLSPGDATLARFDAEQGSEEAALGSLLTFRVHSDRKLTVDIESLLILLAALVTLILAPVLILDFIRFKRTNG